MPKFRSIHTKITQSFDFNDMPDDFTRLVWVLLPLGLDCEGRGIYNFSWIKSKIFPIRDDISEKKLKKALEWLKNRKNPETKLGMIEIYSVDDRLYFWVPTFKSYQRGFEKEAESVLPAPPVETNSEPTPDLLQSKSSLKANAQSNAQSNANANVNSPSFGTHEVSETQMMIEKHAGILITPGEIQILNRIEKMQPLEEDFVEAIAFLKGVGVTAYRLSQLEKPVAVAKAKRTQKNNKSPTKKTVADVVPEQTEEEIHSIAQELFKLNKAREAEEARKAWVRADQPVEV